ncbi:ATP-binding protein [Mucilaginibacter sp. 10B2]|nr:ATP-binding protein [Mucilaginibacter sp. 10B2]
MEYDNLYKELLKENDFYKSIIENNSFYIIKTDLEGKYTYMNPFFCKMLSIQCVDWVGKDSMSLIIPEDHQACIDTVTACFVEPEISHWVMLRKPVPKGIIATQWEFKMLKNEEGVPFEILCIGHDITSLVLGQEELEELVGVTSDQNKRLVNFTYIISHNIRSHVANIIGIINLNEADEKDIDDKTALKLIKASINSLDDVIHSLNEIISIQSNTNLVLKVINVQFEIDRIVKSIQILIRNAETTINYLFNPEQQLNTNPTYFESILLNLITNAIKYKSPTLPLIININLFVEGNFKILTFNDNGLGIDLKKHYGQLFGMYNTFHGNKDAKGLGLFIIKTQIEALRGRIEVKSQLGEGTTFKVFFPNTLVKQDFIVPNTRFIS